MRKTTRKQVLFYIRDSLFFIAVLLADGWIMYLAVMAIFISVVTQFRSDYKSHKKADAISVVYIIIALATLFLLIISLFPPTV